MSGYVDTLGSNAPEAAALQDKYRQEMIGIWEKDLLQIKRDMILAESEIKTQRARI